MVLLIMRKKNYINITSGRRKKINNFSISTKLRIEMMQYYELTRPQQFMEIIVFSNSKAAIFLSSIKHKNFSFYLFIFDDKKIPLKIDSSYDLIASLELSI